MATQSAAYAPVVPTEDVAPGGGGRRIALLAAAAGVAAVVGVAATSGLAGLRPAGDAQPKLRRFPEGSIQGAYQHHHLDDELDDEDAPTWVQGGDFASSAPPMDIDYDYHYEGWGTNYDHIPDPEFCAGMCQGVEKCKAYTWVKDAGLDGCPSQCWLKGGVGYKKKKKGVVSGVPPPRQTLVEVPKIKAKEAGSLYCFALMVPGGYEQGLLQWQHDHSAGIFGCDGYGVYSNKPVEISTTVVAKVVNSTLKCGYGGDSNSALNSWIFIAVWDKVIDTADYKKHDWVVKVDPDAVFFPDRLAKMLVPYAKTGGYINNCKYGMHGPIEVFSTDAIDILAADYRRSWDGKAPKSCSTELHFGLWGEDMFIDQCLSKVLDVKPRPLESKLMCESHCDCPNWYWCNSDPDTVSYHPFKSIEAYSNCLANGIAGKPEITHDIDQ